MNWTLKEAFRAGQNEKRPDDQPAGGEGGSDGAASQEADDLYNRLFGTGTQGDTAGRGAQSIQNVGDVALLSLPRGWTAGAQRDDSTGYAFTYRPEGNDNVSLSLLYRGRPLDNGAADRFAGILTKPAGYQLNPGEIADLQPLLRDKADAEEFSMSSAKVHLLNGKKVLAVTGTYKDQPVRTTSYYINTSRDGRVVQELAYVAPRDQFLTYWQQADSALRSIKWK